MTFPRMALTVGCALVLAACGEDNNPVDPGPGDTREILTNPSFATDINEIIQRRGCSAGACHGAAGGRAGLELVASAAANYANLVGVQATSESFQLVEAGNPDDSYLVIKVEGRQTVGQRMPRGAAALDNIDLTNIRNWISNGAPNN